MTTKEAIAIISIDSLALDFIDYARNQGDDMTADYVWNQLQRYEKALPSLPDVSKATDEDMP
jgi:hypothetical protein